MFNDLNYKPLSSTTLKFVLTALLLAVLFVLNLFVGSVNIPFDDVVSILFTGRCNNEAFTFIVLHSRMPQAVTALLCGGSLAVAGLMLQTTFHNHLADPSILGISSGASLGVAVVLLCFGGTTLAIVGKGWVVIIVAALLGSMLVLGILLMLATFITNELLLLIVGIVISFLTSSCITLLNYFANEQGVHSYILWGMGSFGSVTTEQLPIFVVFTVVGWILSVALVKPLNALLLGNNYARNLGVNIKLTYQLLLVATGLLTAVTTAFCGPISFIGLAVPHLARIALRSSHHNTLLPFTLLCGSMVALLCNFLCVLPGKGTTLPVNAVTPIIGVPVILYVIFSGYRNRISLSFGRKISPSSTNVNHAGILSAANLTIGYGKKVVASDINLWFEKGEFVCLLGRNGAGKSTLLRTLSGFLKPIKGSVFLEEENINRLTFRQISKFVGVVLTDKVQVDNITVEQVVSFGRQPHTGYFGRLSNHDKEIVGEMIAKVGLAHKQHSYFSDLSDGERQKTMIAKALTQECEVLILDEPTAFLDEQSQLDIMLLLKHIAHNEHKLVILSTHQSALANEHADRIVKI